MKISKKEIQVGLNQLVGIKFLKFNEGKYCFDNNYKKILMKSKGNNVEEILLDALKNAGYFLVPKTEKEILVVMNLLLLKK